MSYEDYKEFNATIRKGEDERSFGFDIKGRTSNSKQLTVAYVVESSAAEKAGLRTGDQITKIDGKDVTELSHQEANRLKSVASNLKGKVTLTLRRPFQDRIFKKLRDTQSEESVYLNLRNTETLCRSQDGSEERPYSKGTFTNPNTSFERFQPKTELENRTIDNKDNKDISQPETESYSRRKHSSVDGFVRNLDQDLCKDVLKRHRDFSENTSEYQNRFRRKSYTNLEKIGFKSQTSYNEDVPNIHDADVDLFSRQMDPYSENIAQIKETVTDDQALNSDMTLHVKCHKEHSKRSYEDLSLNAATSFESNNPRPQTKIENETLHGKEKVDSYFSNVGFSSRQSMEPFHSKDEHAGVMLNRENFQSEGARKPIPYLQRSTRNSTLQPYTLFQHKKLSNTQSEESVNLNLRNTETLCRSQDGSDERPYSKGTFTNPNTSFERFQPKTEFENRTIDNKDNKDISQPETESYSRRKHSSVDGYVRNLDQDLCKDVLKRHRVFSENTSEYQNRFRRRTHANLEKIGFKSQTSYNEDVPHIHDADVDLFSRQMDPYSENSAQITETVTDDQALNSDMTLHVKCHQEHSKRSYKDLSLNAETSFESNNRRPQTKIENETLHGKEKVDSYFPSVGFPSRKTMEPFHNKDEHAAVMWNRQNFQSEGARKPIPYLQRSTRNSIPQPWTLFQRRFYHRHRRFEDQKYNMNETSSHPPIQCSYSEPPTFARNQSFHNNDKGEMFQPDAEVSPWEINPSLSSDDQKVDTVRNDHDEISDTTKKWQTNYVYSKRSKKEFNQHTERSNKNEYPRRNQDLGIPSEELNSLQIKADSERRLQNEGAVRVGQGADAELTFNQHHNDYSKSSHENFNQSTSGRPYDSQLTAKYTSQTFMHEENHKMYRPNENIRSINDGVPPDSTQFAKMVWLSPDPGTETGNESYQDPMTEKPLKHSSPSQHARSRLHHSEMQTKYKDRDPKEIHSNPEPQAKEMDPSLSCEVQTEDISLNFQNPRNHKLHTETVKSFQQSKIPIQVNHSKSKNSNRIEQPVFGYPCTDVCDTEDDETLQSKTRNADKRWNCLSVPAKSTKYAKEKHEANITTGRKSIYFQNQYKEMTSENEGRHGELTKSQELNAKSSLQRHDFNSNPTCTRFPEEHKQSFNWIDQSTKTKQDKQVSPTWNPLERHDEYRQTRHYPQGTTTIQDQESHANTKFHDQCQDENPEILKNHDEYTETFKQQDQHDTSTFKQQDQHDTSTFKQQDQHDTSTFKQQDQHDTSTFTQQDQHDTSTIKQQDQHDTSTFTQQDQHDTSTFKQQDQHDTSTLPIWNSNERATDDCQNWVTEEEAHVEESHFSNKENFDDRFDDQSLHADETTQRKYSHEETLLKNQKICLKTFEEPDQQFDSVNRSRKNSSFEQQIPTEMDHKFVTRHEQPNHDSLECKNPQPGVLSKHVPQEETKVDTDEMPMLYDVRADITPYSECSLEEITNIKNATERNERKIRKRLPKKRTSTKTGNEFIYDNFKVQHFYRNAGILDVKVLPSTKMRNHENYPVTFYDKESTPDTKEKTERSENRKEVMAEDNIRDTVQKALLKEGRKSETRDVIGKGP